jgi:hypothetical protein
MNAKRTVTAAILAVTLAIGTLLSSCVISTDPGKFKSGSYNERTSDTDSNEE